ncbi:MAG: arylesterase [Verrucomicrobia bacterium]|nr:arylesterase [Verrucomicrobiota bacterium]
MRAENTGIGPKASLRTKRGRPIRAGFVCAVLAGMAVATAGAAERSAPAPGGQPPVVRTIVFFGDSLTAGYGLANPNAEAFPAVIQGKLDAARRPWRVVNSGLSGETSSGGLRRIDWVLRQPPDAFVLALGANDGLRGIEPAVTRTNLTRIIERVRAKNPAVVVLLAGMQMPPNLGPDYTRDFATLYPAVAQAARATLVPFLLEGVGGVPELNQADGIHPTAGGHRKIAETIWAHLLPLL